MMTTSSSHPNKGSKDMNQALAMKSYRNVNANALVMDASPHKLIQMLMQGALDRLASAKGCIAHGDIEGRNTAINKTVNIIAGLQEVLDKDKGGEVADNLNRLYDYMIRRLYDANRLNDAGIVDEVAKLMLTVKDGWDAIGQQAPGAPR